MTELIPAAPVEVPEQAYRDAAAAWISTSRPGAAKADPGWLTLAAASHARQDSFRAAVEVAYRAGRDDEAERIGRGIEGYWGAPRPWKARFARIARAHGVVPEPPPPIQDVGEAAYFCEPEEQGNA